MAEALRLRVEKLVYGGEGLSHADGQTVFVPFTLPGEEITFAPVERRKKWIRGRAIAVLEPSPDRVDPSCPHFGTCGGCHYQHTPYAAQLKYKTDILRETLHRIGGLDWDGPITVHESPPLGYRNRAQWVVRRVNGRQTLGYFAAGTSDFCEATVCPVLSPRLAQALAELRELLSSKALPETLSEIEALADSSDERLLLNVAFDRPGERNMFNEERLGARSFPTSRQGRQAGRKPQEESAPPFEALAATLKKSIHNLESLLLLDRTRNRMELFGPGYIFMEAAGQRYRVSHLSFFQVNRFLAGELLPAVIGEGKGALALDLFAGVGFFSIPLAKTFERVIAVEAAASARHPARREQAAVRRSPS